MIFLDSRSSEVIAVTACDKSWRLSSRFSATTIISSILDSCDTTPVVKLIEANKRVYRPDLEHRDFKVISVTLDGLKSLSWGKTFYLSWYFIMPFYRSHRFMMVRSFQTEFISSLCVT